jgi:hypothetical protein
MPKGPSASAGVAETKATTIPIAIDLNIISLASAALSISSCD